MSETQAVRIMCPNLSCRAILAVPSSARGKLVRCKACGTNITVPAKAPEAPVAAAEEKGSGESAKVA